jgi:hypothetical protein
MNNNEKQELEKLKNIYKKHYNKCNSCNNCSKGYNTTKYLFCFYLILLCFIISFIIINIVFNYS